jgi:predicted PurR-regulated permease PerM
MVERRYGRIFLLVSSLLVFYYVIQIFRPFLLPVALAAVLVSLSYPSFDWTSTRLKNRRGWAALITCLWITILIIVPFVLVLVQLGEEVALIYKQFDTMLNQGKMPTLTELQQHPLLASMIVSIGGYVDLDKVDLAGGLASALKQVSLFFLRHSSSLLGEVVHMISNFLVMLFTMFFLFRDGSRLKQEAQELLPLSQDYQERISGTFRQVASATVIGSLLTSVTQGVAGGLIFWGLGIPHALFWGSLTAFVSLVPVVGTALVWVPWTLYLLGSDSVVHSIVFLVLFLLVGFLDNVLRPFLLEGRVKIHSLLIFFSLLGGIGYFGMPGMIFGPILVALGLTFLELYKLEFGMAPRKTSPE